MRHSRVLWKMQGRVSWLMLQCLFFYIVGDVLDFSTLHQNPLEADCVPAGESHPCPIRSVVHKKLLSWKHGINDGQRVCWGIAPPRCTNWVTNEKRVICSKYLYTFKIIFIKFTLHCLWVVFKICHDCMVICTNSFKKYGCVCVGEQ